MHERQVPLPGPFYEDVMGRIPLANIRRANGSNRGALVRRSIFTVPQSPTLSGWGEHSLRNTGLVELHGS